MRLCSWAWACYILVILSVLRVKADQHPPKERHYYIAAVEIDWNYSGDDTHRSGPTYKKVVFREYEKGFQRAKPHPSWLGLLGPTLRAEVGETIVVTFRNMATGPYSIHPHGVAYGKQSEGAYYFDNTSQKEKEDDVVQPNSENVYYWGVTPEVSPQPNDPTCLTYTYISHKNVVEDYNTGLIGTLLVCKPGSLDESGKQMKVHQEYVFLFGVFDEKESKFKPSSHASDNHVKYTINGFTKGTLPDVTLCAHASVSLHLVGMSSNPEVFSVHINGQVLKQNGHKLSSVGLISGSAATASIVAFYTGRWLISSHTIKHMEVGMHGYVNVEKCDGFEVPQRRMTIAQKKQMRKWTYYIAAEEIIWDYAPNMPQHIDEDFKNQYLRQSPTRIGGKYKKAVFVLYKNESFTERQENKARRNELGILGPVIRAQIRDVIKIVFKNKATKPYSIYPHGLTIAKSQEGYSYPAGSNQSHSVKPGETHIYEWNVIEEDEPFESDSRCLTRMYHSAVDTPRDISSGLIGPMLICKSQSLNVRNVQLKADKEQHAMFAVLDENKSWYLDDNIRQYCDGSKVKKAEPGFYKSNIMHTINGYAIENGTPLGFCNGEVVTWHVSSIGAQDCIQTATFYGHPFELNERTEDFLNLYPMTGETITMNMDNIGIWLLASLSSHETTKGVRVKFQDVECFRDYEYEYSDEEKKEFTMWKPLSLDEIKKKEEMLQSEKNIERETDEYTDNWADLLGIRSMRNQTNSSDVEELDLSFLDYDNIDMFNQNTNNSINLTVANSEISTSVAKQNRQNETSFLNWKEVGGLNITEMNLLNQSIVENTTNVKNNSRSSTFDSSLNEAKTVYYSLNRSLKSRTKRMKVMSTSDDQSSVDIVGDPEGRLTTEDVFSYHLPLSNESIITLHNKSEANITFLSRNTEQKDENNTSMNPFDGSTDGVNRSMSMVNFEDDIRNILANSPIFELEMSPDNKLNDSSVTIPKGDSGLHRNPSKIVTNTSNFSLENVTNIGVKVESVKVPKNNVLPLFPKLNNTSVKRIIYSSDEMGMESTDALNASDSTEEVFFYLKENNTHSIKTTSGKTLGYNWIYDETHQAVPLEIPDYMMKYIGKDMPQTTPAPKKARKVNRRQRPRKGQSMKTKRKKEYKPQSRSDLPFSPRGFNPDMTPRGSRPQLPKPISDEAELINMPVVIGVPRPHFSDYQLYLPGDEPDHLVLDEQDLTADEYEYVSFKDPYSGHKDIKDLNMDVTNTMYLNNQDPNVKTYFIAAEEVLWDYGGYGQKRQENSHQNSRETKFTKVVFRSYMDSTFSTREIRGEIYEHLGILGPVIKAEIHQTIMVVFKNNAKRPYSLHPNGVSYTKQTEGLSYEDDSKYWYTYDNEVQPNATFTYVWKVNSNVGPMNHESRCRTWAYYSGVNPERDIHSGLIGPLLVCQKDTLDRELPNMREFILLFMIFDESQSWYYEKNREIIQRKNRRKVMDPNFKESLKFHSINGIVYNLKGLRMYTNHLVCWHLISMGSSHDFQSVHFHGQTFLHKTTTSYRQAIYPLLPGSFATLEMYPSKPGLWQLETEVGFNQEKGMQTLFLVLDDDCFRPLGLESGSVKDKHITANNTREYWEPHLARLNNQGKYNAWSTEQNSSWIQVDFQRPVIISQVATQGAKQLFYSQFVRKYLISYSTDRRKWTFYKGDSKAFMKVFTGNQEAYETKTNTFFPPMVGRFIRLHPIDWYEKATVRMEFYGCELDGCSVPLGMESGLIEDHRITASSTAHSWYSGPWKPSLGRLNRQGTINAWQAKYNNMNQWLQVELPQIKKITGIITQGARSLGKEMYVMSYTLEYSNDGRRWSRYTDNEDYLCRAFVGNANNSDHVKNYIHPPIFSRYIRIIPRSWVGSITMRIELLGCDFE